ncbi:MAG: NAD(P)-dependent oxidoreductase [Opitutaceae bacterium]|nr:NAD(P)-dependent oxidoreductase [Opitutaceae bacterium]
MKSKIGFIGVGAMGAGMAANLCKKGFEVAFYSRDTVRGRESTARLAREGARPVADLPALGRRADVVILCLPDSPSVEGVLDDAAGLTASLPSGAIVVDCSTSYPESTRRLAAHLATRKLTLLEGPLTGSRAQAEAGTVSVLGAGPREAFVRARPVLEGFAARVFYLGGTGAGHTAKLINNFFGQLALAGLCEAWPLINAYGIEPQVLFDAISASGGNSALFQGAYPRLRQRDFSFNFAQRLAGKDVRYFKELAQAAQLPAPIAESLLAVHQRATAAGYGDQDFKALLLFYEEQASKSAKPPAS